MSKRGCNTEEWVDTAVDAAGSKWVEVTGCEYEGDSSEGDASPAASSPAASSPAASSPAASSPAASSPAASRAGSAGGFPWLPLDAAPPEEGVARGGPASGSGGEPTELACVSSSSSPRV